MTRVGPMSPNVHSWQGIRCSVEKSAHVNSFAWILCIVEQEFATVPTLYVSNSFPLMDYLLLLFLCVFYQSFFIFRNIILTTFYFSVYNSSILSITPNTFYVSTYFFLRSVQLCLQLLHRELIILFSPLRRFFSHTNIKTIGHPFGFHGLRFLKPSYVSIVALLPSPEGIGDSLYRFISII